MQKEWACLLASPMPRPPGPSVDVTVRPLDTPADIASCDQLPALFQHDEEAICPYLSKSGNYPTDISRYRGVSLLMLWQPDDLMLATSEPPTCTCWDSCDDMLPISNDKISASQVSLSRTPIRESCNEAGICCLQHMPSLRFASLCT